jgi:hypothetical protein
MRRQPGYYKIGGQDSSSFQRVVNLPCIVSIELRNESQYSQEIVWENAQDVEHVATLHPTTNEWFRIFHHTRNSSRQIGSQYDDLVFLSRRRLAKIFKVSSVGVRKLVSKYNIQQVEYSPQLRIYTVLDSKIEEHPTDPDGSILHDSVRVYGPRWYRLVSSRIRKELVFHAKQQCIEDETFRSRRFELTQRNVNFPYRLLDSSIYEVFFESEEK